MYIWWLPAPDDSPVSINLFQTFGKIAGKGWLRETPTLGLEMTILCSSSLLRPQEFKGQKIMCTNFLQLYRTISGKALCMKLIKSDTEVVLLLLLFSHCYVFCHFSYGFVTFSSAGARDELLKKVGHEDIVLQFLRGLEVGRAGRFPSFFT